MKDLSIVIVNYNVKHFLEQCLHSVNRAIQTIDAEVFVVDNNSVDGSCAMLKEKFPDIHLIENKKNVGFSIANNQAIKISKGKYVLLLNPDTVVEEDTFTKILTYMDDNPKVGGLGVKMIDGKGKFLPESKRGLPTPNVAFYKIFGLSALFKKSKRFGQYHLSYLDKNKIHKVDILSGAFMFMRKEALDKVGLLDETFFMYGEDIDLSYRIIKGGYDNVYFPDTCIIHYKGESTKKGSINYVKVFYQAMIIFAKKHFSQKHAKLFSLLINLAIYFRAALAIMVRFAKRLLLPLIDLSLILLTFHFLTPIWETNKFGQLGYYPPDFLNVVVPVYALVWMLSMYFNGGYDKPLRIWKLIRGILFGSVIILLGYSLLPESVRYSRALILLGSAAIVLLLPLVRLLGFMFKLPGFAIHTNRRKRIALVGSENEIKRITDLIELSGISNSNIIGNVSPEPVSQSEFFLGGFNQLDEVVRIHKLDEIVFCAKDISSQKIISAMLNLSELNVDYKIATPDGISVIGSNSINTAGDLYSLQINTIVTVSNRRKKRIIDIVMSVLILALLPIFMIISKSILGIIRNTILVLFGFRSWVGYADSKNNDDYRIPVIKKGIVTTADPYRTKNFSSEKIGRMNLLYAKDYRILYDLSIIIRSLPCLGKKIS